MDASLEQQGRREPEVVHCLVLVGDVDQSRLGQNAHRSLIGEASRENEERGKKS